MDSNCLVSSRQTVRRRSGIVCASAAASASMRCGASKITQVPASSASRRRSRSRAAAFGETKPAKRKPCPAMSPAALSAVTTLLGPGSGITRKPASRTAATSRAPGSEIAGVPASLT